MTADAVARSRSLLTRSLAEVRATDGGEVGGKAANLGEMIGAGFPVPPGFVVPAGAYLEAMDRGGVRRELADLHADALQVAGGSARLDELSARAVALVRRAGTDPELADAVRRAYAELPDETEAGATVAVRSSAVGEDGADASFAGMNATFTNVQGPAELLDSIVGCWASVFASRVIAYRAERGMTGEPAIAVVVQVMIAAQRAGVAFTAAPVGGRRDRVVVEAAFGQGEVVVSGAVEPDTYEMSVDGRHLVSARIGHQTHEIVRGRDGSDLTVELDPERAAARVLTDDEAAAVARLAVRVQTHFGVPQDVEWAFTGSILWLLQARPITTLTAPGAGSALVTGLAAAPGRATGRVRVLQSPEQGAALHEGEVLVAPMTNPDWLPTIRRAAALVTDSGGSTCHAAIVARELGVPCVVGTRVATTALHDGLLVTVDGNTGEVVPGDRSAPARPAVATPVAVAAEPAPIGTKLYVNLAMPEHAAEVAAGPVDGVGLLRAEFMLTEALGGRHPREVIARGDQAQFVASMSASLLTITEAFAPRPVIYRATDLRSNEFRGLEGGAAHEPVEHNPMIGYRGAYRYLKEPDLFALELQVLAQVREHTPNLHLMIPFVRTRWELEACLELVDVSPLGRQRGLHRWVMAEVPSVLYWLPAYVGLGIDGVSIGSNDLTQLVLGVDRDSEVCAELYDETDPAVLAAIGDIVATANRLGITSSLCGQAPSVYPGFVDHLVDAGITSISVNPTQSGPRVPRSPRPSAASCCGPRASGPDRVEVVGAVRPDDGGAAFTGPMPRRGTDVLRGVGAGVLVGAGAVVVLLAVLTGVGIHGEVTERGRVEGLTRVPTDTVLTENTSVLVGGYAQTRAPVLVRAQWRTPDGRPQVGWVTAGPGRKAGDHVTAWIDLNGAMVRQPADSAEALSEGLLSGLGLGIVGTVLLCGVAAVTDRMIAAHNRARWAAEWARVGPTWTRQL